MLYLLWCVVRKRRVIRRFKSHTIDNNNVVRARRDASARCVHQALRCVHTNDCAAAPSLTRYLRPRFAVTAGSLRVFLFIRPWDACTLMIMPRRKAGRPSRCTDRPGWLVTRPVRPSCLEMRALLGLCPSAGGADTTAGIEMLVGREGWPMAHSGPAHCL